MPDRNNRIRQIRRHFDLTQQEFADRIGVKRNTIASYETGRNLPIDSVISLICREFGVSEIWLRTGEGEMMDPRSDDALDNLAREKGLSIGERLLIEKFLDLKPEVRRALVDYAVEVSRALAAVQPPKSTSDPELDNLESEYKKMLSGSASKPAPSASSSTDGSGAESGRLA